MVRFEILLPLYYNDGRSIEQGKFFEIILRDLSQFFHERKFFFEDFDRESAAKAISLLTLVTIIFSPPMLNKNSKDCYAGVAIGIKKVK